MKTKGEHIVGFAQRHATEWESESRLRAQTAGGKVASWTELTRADRDAVRNDGRKGCRVAITVHFIAREEGGKLAGRTKMNQLSLKEWKEFISESTSIGLHTEETLQAETRKSNA
jgi:hypothetical protein